MIRLPKASEEEKNDIEGDIGDVALTCCILEQALDVREHLSLTETNLVGRPSTVILKDSQQTNAFCQ